MFERTQAKRYFEKGDFIMSDKSKINGISDLQITERERNAFIEVCKENGLEFSEKPDKNLTYATIELDGEEVRVAKDGRMTKVPKEQPKIVKSQNSEFALEHVVASCKNKRGIPRRAAARAPKNLPRRVAVRVPMSLSGKRYMSEFNKQEILIDSNSVAVGVDNTKHYEQNGRLKYAGVTVSSSQKKQTEEKQKETEAAANSITVIKAK